MYRRSPASILVVVLLCCAAFNTATRAEERVQLWQNAKEEPLAETSLPPTVHSVAWNKGDLEIQFTQAAPCGEWMPVMPLWTVEDSSVVLDFYWVKRLPQDPEPASLCRKHVRAWVFDVPDLAYSVSFGRSVQLFQLDRGKVVVVHQKQ